MFMRQWKNRTLCVDGYEYSFKYEYSLHAEGRLSLRGVKETRVLEALDNGFEEMVDAYYEGHKDVVLLGEDITVFTVVDEDEDGNILVLITTVLNKKGFVKKSDVVINI